jgi:hypothetical protein
MVRYVLRFFGIPVLTWEETRYEIVGDDSDLDLEDIAGGSSHNFERDSNPPIPGTENDFDSWADRPFGFRRVE